MSRRTATWVAWGSCVLTVALLASAIVVGSLDSPTDKGSGGIGSLLAASVFVLAFSSVGALVASRLPSSPIGWIMCVAGLAYAVGGISVTYVEWVGPSDPHPGPVGTFAAWVSSWVWMVGVGPVMTLLLLLFPNGHLPSPRWRPVAVLAGGGLALMVGGLALTPGRFEDLAVSNPVGVPGAKIAVAVGTVALLAGAVAAIASLVVRYRHGRHDERQQLKWLTYAAALVGVALGCVILVEAVVSSDTTEFSNTVVTAAVAGLPIAIGIAILRHGLYDVDLVINRTLVYGALTATLAGAYLGGVLLLQLALGPLTEDNGLAIAGSTLAVAALVRPARAHIQALVDRRFYRNRYDAQRTLESFGGRLRDEVDLDALGGDLRGVVAETMQPAHVSLWLRRTGR